MKHANISIFVPHIGCPHMCSFCNQRSISGAQQAPTVEDVKAACLTAKNSLGSDVARAELAFFGGSFTAIEREYMLTLLTAAKECVDEIGLMGIRCSTRPDAIDDEIIDILLRYGVTAVELGVQSMDDEVLRQNNRGHTAAQVKVAAGLIKQSGISLGLQMMTGLYTDTPEKSLATARELIALAPDTVRIYPTIVMCDTELERLYRQGKYTPPTLEEAVELCSQCLELFTKAGVNVIRLGLHSSESMQAGMAAGPYHPAFRELCESRIFLQKILDELKRKSLPQGDILAEVNPKNISKVIGQSKKNVEILRDLKYNLIVRGSGDIKGDDIKLSSL